MLLASAAASATNSLISDLRYIAVIPSGSLFVLVRMDSSEMSASASGAVPYTCLVTSSYSHVCLFVSWHLYFPLHCELPLLNLHTGNFHLYFSLHRELPLLNLHTGNFHLYFSFHCELPLLNLHTGNFHLYFSLHCEMPLLNLHMGNFPVLWTVVVNLSTYCIFVHCGAVHMCVCV